MFPYKDDNPSISFPWVTCSIISLNTVIFFASVSGGFERFELIVYGWGFIPYDLFHGANFYTLFMSMFIHGSFGHLLGNMWMLWIFGDNIEDRMKNPLMFIGFYLIAGLIAALAHGVVSTNSTIPCVGASGAISGVMGAYLILYPYAKIRMLFIFFFYFKTFKIPALIFLVLWIVGQVYDAFHTLGIEGAGIAFFAHIGGFFAGIILIKLFRKWNWLFFVPIPSREFFFAQWTPSEEESV